MPAASEARSDRRVLTVPNAISVARLLGVPLFLWLLLGPRADGWAVAVLAVAGLSDWADGVLARRLNQYSRIGELLDPAADRLYILATLVGLVVRGVIPWWVAGVLVGRDLILGVALLWLRRYGYAALPVHYLGKAATFALLYAFPFLLLGSHRNVAGITGQAAAVAWPIAWAFTIWGVGLYLVAGVLYLGQVWCVVRPRAVPRRRQAPG